MSTQGPLEARCGPSGTFLTLLYSGSTENFSAWSISTTDSFHTVPHFWNHSTISPTQQGAAHISFRGMRQPPEHSQQSRMHSRTLLSYLTPSHMLQLALWPMPLSVQLVESYSRTPTRVGVQSRTFPRNSAQQRGSISPSTASSWQCNSS